MNNEPSFDVACNDIRSKKIGSDEIEWQRVAAALNVDYRGLLLPCHY